MSVPLPPSLRRDERGIGLLFSLFAAAIVAVVAWTMVTNGLVDLAISDNYRSHNAAFYAADAGIEQTLIDFKIDTNWATQLVDLQTATVTGPGQATITVNGIPVELDLDQAGLIVPKYYPMGLPATIGDATYSREVYLPPIVAAGDCAEVDLEAPLDGSGSSKDSKSKDSKSKDSKSKDSKSKDSKSKGGGGDDPCSVLQDLLDDDSGSGGSKSKDSKSKDSKSKDSKSKDSKSKDSKSKDSKSDDDALAALWFANATPGGLALASAGLGAEPQVTICHYPPGNPGNAKTLSVGVAAVAVHVEQHGDTLGACADDGGDTPISDGTPVYVIFKVRSTGTSTNGATTRVLAQLAYTLSTDGEVLNVNVQNWRLER